MPGTCDPLFTGAPASAQLDQFLKGLGIGQPSGLTDAKIGSGLKEALKVGTENTVKLTGRTDGYFMKARPDVDPRRIAVMGWSHGGGTTLMTLGAAPEDPVEGFRAAIAFYPGCRGVPPWRTKTPTLILIGEVDDWSAAAPCQALADRQRRGGLDVMQVTYPRAHHGFDNPLLGPEKRRVPDARGGRGATMQYNPAAAEDSRVRVREFLAKHLKD